MDRQDLFRTESAKLIEPIFQRSLAALLENYTQNKEEIRHSLQETLENLYCQAGEMQAAGEKGTIAWLGVCYCLSSIYTGNYEIRLDLYNKESYLDEKTCCVYWNPIFITSYLLEDKEAFRKAIRQKVPRVKTYEEQQFFAKYMRSYMYILSEFLRQQIPDVLASMQKHGVQETEDFQIFFGEYMGNYIILNRSEI